MKATNYDFDQRIETNVPKNPADFQRVFDEDYLELFTMFEIVNSREESLFEFNAVKNRVDAHRDPKAIVGSPERVARVEALRAFYSTNDGELSPFED